MVSELMPALIALVPRLFNILLQLVKAVIVVRFIIHTLGPAQYALWVTVFSFLAYFSFTQNALSDGILRQAAFTFGTVKKDDHSAIFTTGIVLTTFQGIIILLGVSLGWFVGSQTHQFDLFDSQVAVTVLLCGGISIVINNFGNIFYVMMIATNRPFRAQTWLLVYTCLEIGAYIIVLKNGYGLSMLGFSLLVVSIVSLLIAGILESGNRSVQTYRLWNASYQVSKKIMRMSLTSLIFQVGKLPIQSGLAFIIGLTLGQHEVALFTPNFSLWLMIAASLGILVDVSWPRIAALGLEKPEGRVYVTRQILYFTLVVGGGILGPMITQSQGIISWWIGEEYVLGSITVTCLSILALLKVWEHVYTYSLFGLGETVAVPRAMVWQGCMFVVFVLLIGVHYGLLGIALSAVFSVALTSMWYLPYRATLTLKLKANEPWLCGLVVISVWISGIIVSSILNLIWEDRGLIPSTLKMIAATGLVIIPALTLNSMTIHPGIIRLAVSMGRSLRVP